ncbi:MarR family transcriptional regulator [Achromobacter sp. GG226]|uniref:MarR family transcriptional regulator n=1 Tax=Verticiella alkaliphila TaxID=2779529 RepID=UPI001C0DA54D|nr:MarR family transcriptional regulator [Verticiella sp. GG226]MBU4609159.1 MarR family transcriptional regulator [Verticiella sp. GG226]
MTPASQQDAAVLAALAHHPQTRQAIAQACGMSDALTKQLIRRLTARGQVYASGRTVCDDGIRRPVYALLGVPVTPAVAQTEPVRVAVSAPVVAAGFGAFRAMAQQLGRAV